MKSAVAGLVVGLMASCALGDQLVIMGGQTKEGSFQGFENGKIRFQPTKGRFMKEQPSRVSKLILSSKTKATYTTTDGKTEEEVDFKGFEKGKFIFVKDGKEVLVMAIKMKELDPCFEIEGGGGGDAGGQTYPIPKVDLSNFGGDLNANQQTVLDQFKEAKKAFDDFLLQSTAMVQEMDKLKGPKREELLNELRRRKEAEQPLRRGLRSAYKALVAAFSDPEDGQKPADKSQAEKPATTAKPAGGRATGGLRSPAK